MRKGEIQILGFIHFSAERVLWLCPAAEAVSRVPYILKDVSVSVWTAVSRVGNRSEEEKSFQRAQWARPVFISVSVVKMVTFSSFCIIVYAAMSKLVAKYSDLVGQISLFGSKTSEESSLVWQKNSANSSNKNTRLVWTAALAIGSPKVFLTHKMFTRTSYVCMSGVKRHQI